jgi:hypothetical protein
MNILERLADVFVNTFGITQPSPETRRKASWFILALLIGTLAVVALAGTLIYRLLHS